MMRLHRDHTGSGLLVAAALGAGLGACAGEDQLGQQWVPPETEPQEEELGPKSPLQVGTELWYSFAASYRRTVSGGGGLTSGEAQSGGALCMRLTDVQDTATTAYKDAEQTLVMALVRVTGTEGEIALTHADQDNPDAAPDEIDQLLEGLWLKQLTFPTAWHGFERPVSTLFETQAAPVPSAGLAGLPFFDVRTHPGANWSGWQYNVDLEGARNVTGLVISALAEPSKAKTRIVTPPPSCSEHVDVHSCIENDCTWTPAPGGNMSECLSLYALRMVWRETVQTPAEIAGSVFHQVQFMYDAKGILHSATELITPATDDRVPQEITSCSGKCLSAVFLNAGRWNDGQGQNRSICSF